jgi:transcription antitermination factor NusG
MLMVDRRVFKADKTESDMQRYNRQLSRITANENAKWIALFSDSHCESLIQEELKSIGIDAIVPRSRGEKIVRKGKVTEAPMRPLMPGYVFCKVDINDQSQSGLKCIRHVRGILRNNKKPMVVNGRELLKFNDKAASGDFNTDVASVLKPSMNVSVSYGPFVGYSGIVAAVFKREAKLILDGLGLMTLPLDMIAIES